MFYFCFNTCTSNCFNICAAPLAARLKDRTPVQAVLALQRATESPVALEAAKTTTNTISVITNTRSATVSTPNNKVCEFVNQMAADADIQLADIDADKNCGSNKKVEHLWNHTVIDCDEQRYPLNYNKETFQQPIVVQVRYSIIVNSVS